MLSDKLCIQLVGSQYAVLSTRDVIYFEADRQVCHVLLADGSRLTAAHHLGRYKSSLLSEYSFIEISKSLVINLLHVERYLPRERTLVLSGGVLTVVAKSKQEAVTKRFKDWHNQFAETDKPPVVG